ncbi:MAG: methyltransferase [Gemmatimonadetes bacterium]|nr:methyltransferase [Gemmatimonadota bacterium]
MLSRERILAVVRRIPKGRVATYGQVATLAGYEGHARQVGYAMAALPAGSRVPWHRVVNAQGAISMRAGGEGAGIPQRHRLEQEGVFLLGNGRLALKSYQWKPSPAVLRALKRPARDAPSAGTRGSGARPVSKPRRTS